MNIAKIMIPKAFTVFLQEDQSVRKGWEVMAQKGYTAIPVLDREQHYVGSVSEGDFLRFMLSVGTIDMREMEAHRVSDITRYHSCTPLTIDASRQDVLAAVLAQNFVPIVDNRNTLCGIVIYLGLSLFAPVSDWGITAADLFFDTTLPSLILSVALSLPLYPIFAKLKKKTE